jgi:subtilisin family serine protease
VRRSIGNGVTYAIAAGNGNIFGSARVGAALTVSATDATDTKASWANFGSCVDVFAPGVSINSAWGLGDTGTNTISGTSMATPHVAGVVATYLETNPTATPAEVASTNTSSATQGLVTSAGTGLAQPAAVLGPDYRAPATSSAAPRAGALHADPRTDRRSSRRSGS